MCIAYISSGSKKAVAFCALLEEMKIPKASAKVYFSILVVVGGDGAMLRGIHEYSVPHGVSVYGINCGTVGFLMNDYSVENIRSRILNAVPVRLPLLEMHLTCRDGKTASLCAVNEVSIFRETCNTCRIGVFVNGKTVIQDMISDGILVSTPAGSTAYNSSAGGPVVPLSSSVLVLTSINSFRPKRWKSAILPSDVQITIKIEEPYERPASVVADYNEIRGASSVQIFQSDKYFTTILFDKGKDLYRKIIEEQFL